MIATADGAAEPEGRLVHRAPEQLRPHPVYLNVCSPVATGKMPPSPADSTPVIAPLLTTRDGLILDGYTRWQAGRFGRARPSVACIEYDPGRRSRPSCSCWTSIAVPSG